MHEEGARGSEVSSKTIHESSQVLCRARSEPLLVCSHDRRTTVKFLSVVKSGRNSRTLLFPASSFPAFRLQFTSRHGLLSLLPRIETVQCAGKRWPLTERSRARICGRYGGMLRPALV